MQAMKIVESSMNEIDELEKKKHIINKEIEENKNIIRKYCTHTYIGNPSHCKYCGEKKSDIENFINSLL
tara:strand:- start:146 stop:352 length:207 start_codon:yes stop_codon:yes gene_type:complete